MAEPTPWDDLMEALTLLRRSKPEAFNPFNCEHDTLWVDADESSFTPEELERLHQLGFIVNTEYGGFMSYRVGSA